jgi:hypothetical protein
MSTKNFFFVCVSVNATSKTTNNNNNNNNKTFLCVKWESNGLKTESNEIVKSQRENWELRQIFLPMGIL